MNRRNRTFLVIFQILVLFILFLTISFIWASNLWGNITFAEIVFNLNMPLKGTSIDIIESFFKGDVLPTCIVFVIETLILIMILSRSKRRKWWTFCWNVRFLKYSHTFRIRMAGILLLLFLMTWVGVLFRFVDEKYEITDWVKNQLNTSNFIEENYVNPEVVNTVFPTDKRNLIWIFVESAESSNQDITNGGAFDENYTPEMTELAFENVSFSQSEVLEGAGVAPLTGWTVAGLVAQTAGVPMKLYSYDAVYDTGGVNEALGNYVSFLPGAVSLGEILEDEGYNNFFMCGSDFSFGGRLDYYQQHGHYEYFDLNTAKNEGYISNDYYENWGYEDEKLYSYAKEKIEKLANGGKPFNFQMLTADTHFPDGYECELCENDFDKQYANVWACASRQLYDFVKWIQDQDFYENTTIVITGDHCSMQADFYDVYANLHLGSTERKVYNAIINPAILPINEKNRKFTTLDFYPTVLAALGVEIEGNRLGLGTNLFSEEPSLAEKYGFEYMYQEMLKKSIFYDEKILYGK